MPSVKPAVAPVPTTTGSPTPLWTSSMGSDGEIRKFADSGIQKAIDDALNQTLPDGRKAAVVAYVDGNEVRGAVMFKVGNEWSFVATASHGLKNKGDLKYGAAVRWSPF